jgi:hypothetical protein
MKISALTFLVACTVASAQTYDTNNDFVQTFAGSGFFGYVDGQRTQTMFYNPSAIVADSSSNLFVLDVGNHRIRKITPDGTVSTFAGGGAGALPGYSTNISLAAYGFGTYRAMTIDRSNTLWINAINGSSCLLRIQSDGYVSVTNTGVDLQGGICADSGNNLYFSDYGAHKIYRYRTNGILEVFAGSGNQGTVDGHGIFTSFYYPTALTADSADNIYVWDIGTIRRISQNQDVTTIAGRPLVLSDLDGVGTNATFNSISGMCADNFGNIILACGSSIRKMSAATNVVTMAGSFTQSSFADDVAGNLARFNGANGVCASQGMIFVTDSSNQRIRNITFNPTPQPVSAGNLNIGTYAGVMIFGIVGRTYQIQSSLDLSSWNTEATILLTSSPYLWFDQNGLGQKKFYRAFLLP